MEATVLLLLACLLGHLVMMKFMFKQGVSQNYFKKVVCDTSFWLFLIKTS